MITMNVYMCVTPSDAPSEQCIIWFALSWSPEPISLFEATHTNFIVDEHGQGLNMEEVAFQNIT